MSAGPGPVSGMPQMRDVLGGWTQQITMNRRVQIVEDGLAEDTDFPLCFSGTIQPLSPKQVALKPEGQRAWEWLQVHCFSGDVRLDVNDRIVYNDKIFKVMAQNDYSLNGYIEYHLVKDYQP